MDIHIPAVIHSLRDFLREMAIIVLGVLIALSAEQAAEAYHWHHRIQEAEGAIREELVDDDLEQAFIRVMLEKCFEGQLTALDVGAKRNPLPQDFEKLKDAYQPPIRTWDSDAWKAMQSSGVAVHMGAERTEQFANVYSLMPRMQELNWEEGETVWDLQAEEVDGARILDPQRTRIAALINRLSKFNAALADDAREVLRQAKDAKLEIPNAAGESLLAKAKKVYGSCAAAPAATMWTPSEPL